MALYKGPILDPLHAIVLVVGEDASRATMGCLVCELERQEEAKNCSLCSERNDGSEL
jgi:hypothetical protein